MLRAEPAPCQRSEARRCLFRGRAGSVKTRLNDFVARHEVAWELGFGGLAVVFVALAFVEPANETQVAPLIIAEWVITGVFALEFFGRLWAAPDRRAHLRG